jgi:hypothetical protein
VPDITQVVERLSPAGRVGEDEQEMIVPPVLLGVSVVMAVPLVKIYGLPVKLKFGRTSFTAILMIAEEEPPPLVAVIV